MAPVAHKFLFVGTGGLQFVVDELALSAETLCDRSVENGENVVGGKNIDFQIILLIGLVALRVEGEHAVVVGKIDLNGRHPVV